MIDVFQVSVLIIVIAILIIVGSIVVNLRGTKKNREETIATKVLKSVKRIQQGKASPINQKEDKTLEGAIFEQSKKTENKDLSMKEHLSKKFKPKIEKQLKTKVNLLDLNGEGKDFEVLTEIGGVKVLLVLDSGGKIIDYKRK